MTDNVNDGAGEGTQTLRRRLKFRSWHRGTREADLLLGSFADAHLDRFDAQMLADYDRLLEVSDPDLYNWMSGREPIPTEHDTPVMRLLFDHRYPGQD